MQSMHACRQLQGRPAQRPPLHAKKSLLAGVYLAVVVPCTVTQISQPQGMLSCLAIDLAALLVA